MQKMIWYVIAFSVGLIAGLIRKEEWYERQLRSQQERGDYWFDRLQELIKNEVR